MDKNRILFESYNIAIEESYDSFFQSIESTNLLKDLKCEDEDLQKHLHSDMDKWGSAPIKELDGNTPIQYLGGMGSLGAIIEVFRAGAKFCDEGLPGCLLERLREFGDAADNALIALASDRSMLAGQEQEFLTPLMAVKVLGDWKVEKAVSHLIEILLESISEDELLKENIKDALVNIGSPSISAIINALNCTEVFEDAHEYLLIVLSAIGAINRSNDIFMCLKSSFLRMQNKVFGAICLGDYGDGRAIPALRGFVEKNRDTIDAATYYEIKSAIQRLGGSMDDIVINF